ncbi:DMT family transporter [Plantibacter sp. Mn2098]|uniref:DMT family transporter n=1 Tax=Plantibacter sp. Mn2098 TaxID=3395266 RepID=UPI003BDA82B3
MGKQIGILSTLGLVALSAAFVLSWSSGFLAAKLGTVDVAPMTLLVWRFVPLAAGLVLVAIVRHRMHRVPHPSRPALTTQAVIGLSSQFGYVLPVYLAIGLGVSAGTTALIDAVQPIVVATLVGPLLRLRVRALQWVGLALGALGVVLIVASDIASTTAPIWAYTLPLCAMASLVFGTFWERRHPVEMSVFDTLTVHTSVAAIAFVILALATGTLRPPASPDFWLTILFLAAVPTLAAYGLYWILMRRIGITSLNALLFLVAPTTAVLGALLFGEPLTLATVAGLVLAGAAVSLVVLPARPAAPRILPPAQNKEIRTTEG